MSFSALSIARGIFTLSHSAFTIFVALLGIGFLIGFHELGHFLFAKLFNIHTPSFSIGFGPKLISKKIGETNFSLSAIPLGGYVELAGSDEPGQGEQKHSQDKGERSFASKPYWQKLLVMLGGILFNLLFAYFAFVLIFSLGAPKSAYLYPKNASNSVASIADESPAAEAGIQRNDIITNFEGISIEDNAEELLNLIAKNPKKTVTMDIIRSNKTLSKSVTLGSTTFCGQERGMLGITLALKELPPLSFFDALKQGIRETNSWIVRTFQGLWCTITRKQTGSLAGPIRIIQDASNETDRGLLSLLALLAVISINLALLNLLPLPVLDGGQIFFITLESIFRKRIPDSIRTYIMLACWALLMTLILFVSYQDIKQMVFQGRRNREMSNKFSAEKETESYLKKLINTFYKSKKG